MIVLGRNKRTKELLRLNIERSRVGLISGKRGSGKSYTLGVIAEDIFQEKNNIVLIIDPLGIYWTFILANEGLELLRDGWQIKARKFPVKMLLPGNPSIQYGDRVEEKMRQWGILFERFYLNACEITADGWCAFFEYSINEPSGIVLYRAVSELEKTGDFFRVEEIMEKVESDPKAQDKTKEALINRLMHTRDIGLFSNQYEDPNRFFESSYINVIDLSLFYVSAYGLRNLIVGTILRALFRKATLERKFKDLGLAEDKQRIWLLMDEAHQFIPAGRMTLSKEIITSWVKEGRQPGLSVVFVSQQPSSLDNDILSQCDLVIIHRVTNLEDIQALNKLRQEYMVADLKDFLMTVKEKGEALVLDDESERIATIKVRPRMSKHGGTEELV